MWPVALIGFSSGWTIVLAGLQARQIGAGSRRCVLPVTVRQSPSSSPFSSRYFITAGVPPTSCRSSCTYLPLGLRSARYGTRSLTFWKSSIVSGTSDRAGHRDQVQHGVGRAAERHHHDHRVLERRAGHDVARLDVAFRADCESPRRPRGTRRACAGLRPESTSCRAATCPCASIAEAIVLAVYMPPQAPAPGQAVADDLAAARRRSILPAMILAVALKRRDDVELRRVARAARRGSCRRRPSATGG